MKKIYVITLSALLTFGIAEANGKKTGFAKESSSSTASGQGTPGKQNGNANPGNNGQTVTETTVVTEGPKGQVVNNGRTDCNNCETTITVEVIDRPGKKK